MRIWKKPSQSETQQATEMNLDQGLGADRLRWYLWDLARGQGQTEESHLMHETVRHAQRNPDDDEVTERRMDGRDRHQLPVRPL